MTFFTSDQHFGHFNIIRLCSRPFGTVEEMDEALLSKWNAKVKVDDTVYILGDLFFRAAKVEPILKALNGRKHLIVGNHDHTWMKMDVNDFEPVTFDELVENNRAFIASHADVAKQNPLTMFCLEA